MAVWVARVDVSAVRNTRDVNLLIRREDFGEVKTALAEAGFVQGDQNTSEGFDDLVNNVRNAVRVYIENKQTNVADSEDAGAFRVL